MHLKPPFLAGTFVLSTAIVGASANPVDRLEVSIPVEAGVAVPAEVFSISKSEAKVRILTSTDVKENNQSSHGVSIREAERSRRVGRAITLNALLVNGGFSETPTERPAGLLISEGALVSLADFSIRKGDPKNSCKMRQRDAPRLAGVLCIAKDGRASIGDVLQAKPDACHGAIQAGPLLVEKAGEVAICDSEGAEQAFRTAVCLQQGTLSFVVTKERIATYDLARWLATPLSAGGLGCERALNLSGDASSGAVYFPGGFPSFTRRRRVGPGTFPLASLILVESRRLP